MKTTKYNWIKKGLIIEPKTVKKDWMITHGMDPTVDHLHDDIFRIYFCGRNNRNISLIGYADIDITNPDKIIRAAKNPILYPGKLGCFDDNGVTASWIVNYNNKKYLYYIGWKPRSTTRFGLMTGLAISSDNGKTFKRISQAPILQLTNKEPFSILTAPCVLKEKTKWKMWYVSCTGWINPDLPVYNIKYAESKDGIRWKQDGHVCIDFKSKNETALARPCVLYEQGIYKMWYSYKTKTTTYRMGYAESSDGIKWKRLDNQVGINISKSGWDSEMIEYPYVFNHKGKKYMVYNGNGYGTNGIGLAVLK